MSERGAVSGRSLVVDNKGAVVQGHGRPSAVLDSVVLPCKVCYGLLLYSSDQAADGSEPWLRRAQSPSELKMARLVPQDARFRFSCTGKAIHLLQGPSRSGAARKVVLPVCSGLEVVSSNEGAEALGAVPHERRSPQPRQVPDEGSDFSDRFLATASKVAARMKSNAERLITGRRSGE